MKVHEAAIEKRSSARSAPYESKKHQTRSRTKGNLPYRNMFKMNYKELITIPGEGDKLKFPPKTNRNLGPIKDTWFEFHKAFGHSVENCIALGYQLVELVRDDFLKEYLEGDHEGSKEVTPIED